MPKVQIHQVREDIEDKEGRAQSGIPGLDELCEGGFERNSVVLVCGGPGAGKSTFLTQHIYSGAAFYDEPGVIVSLEQPKEIIRQRAFNFGWDLKALEDEGKMAILNYKPHEFKKLAEEGGGLVWDTITEISATRIAIDSLSSYVAYFRNRYDAREGMLALFDMVRKWKCTAVYSAETLDNTSIKTKDEAEFLGDSAIGLYHPRKGGARLKALEIVKMRGTNHSNKLCPYEIIENEGFVVYPGEDVFQEL